ncbi:hypothetical protein PR048_020487 [Dryococelus australis]|uniref:DDE-1 domain-containing protein n=1 Tax=Dryococelus australis TaxID=614101 RepID=A0ABQ9H6E6_9NEOP|nr:hypothetical protein PR048_020487 [Dryococelus australis]
MLDRKLGDTFKRGNRSKKRLTVLLCTNMDGSDKVMPFVVRKLAKPRSFKGNIWLKAFDARVSTRNTELAFLPPNTNSVLQPMDQGIIQLVKNKFCDMLNAEKVTSEFGDEAISPQPGMSAEPQPDTSYDGLPSPALPISKEVWDIIAPGVAYKDYLAVDDMPASGALDVQDLIKDAVPKPTREVMLEATEMLTNGMLRSDADSEVWTSLAHLKKWVITSYSKKKQASITQYFRIYPKGRRP